MCVCVTSGFCPWRPQVLNLPGFNNLVRVCLQRAGLCVFLWTRADVTCVLMKPGATRMHLGSREGILGSTASAWGILSGDQPLSSFPFLNFPPLVCMKTCAGISLLDLRPELGWKFRLLSEAGVKGESRPVLQLFLFSRFLNVSWQSLSGAHDR